MRITVDLPEEELRQICRMTGVSKKGPAIRKLLSQAVRLQRRAETGQKFLAGQWGADLGDFEPSRQTDREAAKTLAEAWRD